MSKKTVRLLTALAVLILVSLVPVRATEASIITLDFTGTYTLAGDVFGKTGSSVPFTYSITYDTALAPSPVFVAAGSVIGGRTYLDDFYGYSKAGITASSLTFGTHTFSASSLQPRVLASGLSADLWFNTNLAIAPPTRVWAFFRDSAGDLTIGGATNSSAGASFRATSAITNYLIEGYGFGDLTMTTDAPATVPEPTSMLLLGTGLLALAARVRRHNA